jgi:hypothetical protein
MPVFTNANSTVVFTGEPYIRLEPGANTTDRYIKGLPTGITLTSHTPKISPWVLLADVSSLPMANSVDVTLYDNIVVFNASDDTVSLSANEDDDNALFIPANSKEVYSNESRMIGCLEVLTMGSGNVYIHGVK